MLVYRGRGFLIKKISEQHVLNIVELNTYFHKKEEIISIEHVSFILIAQIQELKKPKNKKTQTQKRFGLQFSTMKVVFSL